MGNQCIDICQGTANVQMHCGYPSLGRETTNSVGRLAPAIGSGKRFLHAIGHALKQVGIQNDGELPWLTVHRRHQFNKDHFTDVMLLAGGINKRCQVER